MTTRNRLAATIPNQENVVKKNVSTLGMGLTRRAALGEIGNKVNVTRGVQPIHKSSLLPVKKPVAKPAEKPQKAVVPAQVVKRVVKTKTKLDQVEKEIEELREDLQEEVQIKPKFEVVFPSDDIEDIDEGDKNNPILVSNYTKEIHSYLRSLEVQFPIRKNFLTGQEVTPKMRCILISWLVEVHSQFYLLPETLYMTVSIIDRFLQVNQTKEDFRTITTKTLQLVGVTALFIASKYEEMYTPDIQDFMYITENTYNKKEIIHMEKEIVKTLDFSFGRPLSIQFLRRYSKAGRVQPIHHSMSKFFLEESMICYEMSHYSPSLIAAAATYLSILIMGTSSSDDEGSEIWTDTLAHYTTYSKSQVLPVVADLANVVLNLGKNKYQAVQKKYATSKHMKVSLRPELKSPTIAKLAKLKEGQQKTG